jgi:DNA polymerase-3 subunit beta
MLQDLVPSELAHKEFGARGRCHRRNHQRQEAVDELEIDYNGDSIEIGFNVTYLIDVLTNMSQDMVRMDLADSNSSVLVTMAENPNFKYVVMPMRI